MAHLLQTKVISTVFQRVSKSTNSVTKSFGIAVFLLLYANFTYAQHTEPEYFSPIVKSAHSIWALGNQIGSGTRCDFLYPKGTFNDKSSNPSKKNRISAIYVLTSSGYDTQSYTGLRIRMTQDTITRLKDSTYYSGTLTECLNSDMKLKGALKGRWVKIILDHPFTYDPSLSLIVSIERKGMSGKGLDRGIEIYTELVKYQAQTYGFLSGLHGSFRTSSDNYRAVLGFDYISSNDASVLSVDSPAVQCLGKQDIYVTIANLGNTIINGVTVNWELDGVKQAAYNYKGTLDTLNGKGASRVQLNIGKSDLSAHPNLVVYTTNPNSSTDQNIKNDTCVHHYLPELHGRYIIGPSGDFKTIADAVEALNNFYVCGPVEFIIRARKYNGQLEIKQLKGVSAVNTVRFISPHLDSVTIAYSGTSWKTRATLSLLGTSWVSFENIKFEANGSKYAWSAWLTRGANHIKFYNCKFQRDTIASFNNSFAPVMMLKDTTYFGIGSDKVADYVTFENCKFYGNESKYAVYGRGIDTLNRMKSHRYINNDFQSAYIGLTINNIDGLELTGNKMLYLYSPGYVDKSIALEINYVSHFLIQRNYFRGITHIQRGNSYMTPDSLSVFANNMIVGNGFNNLCNFSYVHHTNILHNSIAGECLYLVNFFKPVDIDFRNNILQKTAFNGSCVNLYDDPGGLEPFRAFDYNCYSKTHANLNYVTLTNATYGFKYSKTLAEIKDLVKDYSKNQLNDHNWISDPTKWWISMSKRDFHLSSKFPGLYGPYVGIDVDIDGNPRCSYRVSIGCDEFDTSTVKPVADFELSADTAWQSSPTKIMNLTSSRKVTDFKWYINGKFISDSVDLTYTPKQVGIDTINLVAENCGGWDSISKQIQIIAPLRRPKADFYATDTIIATDNWTQLADQSTSGPAKWLYDIRSESGGKYYFDITDNKPKICYQFENLDSTNQNPRVLFSKAGLYSVKLTTENSKGSDSKEKLNYILVKEIGTMCGSNNISTSRVGTLYDGGGADGEYSYGHNGSNRCNYRISQCNGELVFYIKEFDLANGDYLKMYDGKDSTARPLWDAVNYPKGMTGNMYSSSLTQSFVSNTGSAYFEFTTDNDKTTVGNGFKIEWENRTSFWKKPTAQFNIADSTCANYVVTCSNSTPFGYKSLEWDLFADGVTDGIGESFSKVFSTTGTYIMRLLASSYCWETDTLDKSFKIVQPTTKPAPRFSASDSSIIVNDVVTFRSNPSYCSKSLKWNISPSNWILTSGSLQDEVVRILFYNPGVYSVTLTETNSVGTDSIVKSDYIRVYCNPQVNSLDSRFGISRVQFNTIDNASSMGKSAYTDYSDLSTTVKQNKKYLIHIERNNTSGAMSRAVWVDWNGDGDFDDTGELASSESSSTNKIFEDSILIPATARMGATRMRIVASSSAITNSCGAIKSGEFEDYTIIIIDKDTTPPVITLYGNAMDTVEVFEKWTDPGFIAIDKVDGIVTGTSSGSVNTSKVGIYTIIYKSVDQENNIGIAERKVFVVDTQLPTIELLGPTNVTIQIHETFSDPKAIAHDNYDNNLKIVISGTVNTSTFGINTINYCVTDSSGNGPVCVSRTVLVNDTIPPVISLIGSDKTYAEQCQPYSDLGYKATDNDDYLVDTSGTWDGNSAERDSFTIIYTARDRAGNTASVTRTIMVIDTTAPALILLGNQVDTVKRWSDYVDSGYKIQDDCNDLSELKIDTIGNFVNTESAGVFRRIYQATDFSGNRSKMLIRIIFVEQPEGIHSLNANTSLKIFPNPVKSTLTIKCSIAINSIAVYSYDGKELVNKTVENDFTTLNCSTLDDGLYLIKIFTDSGITMTKFIKN